MVEANVTERTPHRPIVQLPFSQDFRGAEIAAAVNGFEIHEMLGTKMRALFQRRRGRDLFDLYWALTHGPGEIVPAGIIESFRHYMVLEGTSAQRDEFVAILRAHLKDRGFLTDMIPLLRTGIAYDPLVAGAFVIDNLLHLLPIGSTP